MENTAEAKISARIHHIRNGGYLWVFKYDPHYVGNASPGISTRIPRGCELVNDLDDEAILPTCMLDLPLKYPEECEVIPVSALFDYRALNFMQGWICAKLGEFDVMTRRVVSIQNIGLIHEFLEEGNYLKP